MGRLSGCVKIASSLVVLLGLVAILALAFLSYSAGYQRQIRTLNMPPVVQVTGPASGAAAASGSYLNVSATATGTHPILRMELWLDGQVLETQDSDLPEGRSPFQADFSLLIPSEGPHMLFVRAVDNKALIGQSLSVSLVGEPKPANPLLMVTTQAGQTLQDVASAYDTDAEVLERLNPGVSDPPAAGSMLQMPAAPEDKPAGPGGSNSPPAPGNPPVDIPDMQMLTAMDAHVANPFRMPFGVPLPAAPTDLRAEFKDCKIVLRWNDNAEDEDKYNVYVTSAEYEDYREALLFTSLKPSPKTGPAWFELQTGIEGAISLWVEAVNAAGAQPSNIVWVYVPFVSGCPNTAWKAKVITANLLDISVTGNYDRLYCYVSFETKPEQRVPPSAGEFIQAIDGKGQGIQTTFTLDAPSDGVLDVGGKCLGWAGGTLHELGSFSQAFPPATWNKQRQALKGSSYEMGISLKACQTAWCYSDYWPSATDPTLPVPYDVREDQPPDLPGIGPRTRKLSWKWDGDLNKIDAFQVFLNGQPYGQPINASIFRGLEQYVERPRDCGASISWQVATKKGTAVSNLSMPWNYDLPPCQKWLSVRFTGVRLIGTDDGWPSGGAAVLSCETLDAYFNLSAGGMSRSFYGGGIYRPVKCGEYSFSELIGDFYNPAWAPNPEVINIPISSNAQLSGGILVRAQLWDHDDWSGDDVFGSFTEHVYAPPLLKDGRWSLCSMARTTPWHLTGEATSQISFTYAFYPNKCDDIPPE